MLEPQTHSRDSMINLEILRDRRVIESKSCFWSMLQSHAEKLTLYYFDEESRIKNSLSHLDEECIDDSDALILLALIRNQATWLLEYITHNLELLATSILAFDEYHSVDTYEEEMTYLEDTYPFIDGHRLHTILNYVDGWTLDLQEENQEQEECCFPSPGRRRNSSRSINSTKSKRSSVRSESQHNKGSLRNGSFRGFIFLQRLGIKSKSSSSWRIQHVT
ncbi:predicted protein [Chaetoceros tenuissimus]|uniref:Uncharacterized protein n=1 Tax=Chaetoceros tenuissimus TaxID=426638 RepID=A0AAD3CFM9_9STRA|nr:predicted protein [Chaetoceros tenuissimus]